jgi:hypothetical protein
MNHYATEFIVKQQMADRQREADEYRLARAARHHMVKVEEADRLLRVARARSAQGRGQVGWHLTSRPRPLQVRVALVAAVLALLALVGAGAAAQTPGGDPGCIVVSGGKLAC